MKTETLKNLRELGMIIAVLSLSAGLCIQSYTIEDIQHDIKRLEAMIASHEDILVPKHLQGSTR